MESFNRAELVAQIGARLERKRAHIRQAFLDGRSSANETADALAILMDETLQSIWHDVGTHLEIDLADHLALLAVGGYGRGQLAPHSDIDVMFLRVSKNHDLQDQAVKEILYTLWDLKLKIGQSIRTPRECLKLGREDFTILTTLIEMRLIRGSRTGFTALRQAVDRRLLAPHRRAFVAAKMAERKTRHEREGQSHYVLEPNVKENKGGLRDLHALSWIARAVFGDGQVETLMSRGVFSLAQARAYEGAKAVLLTVRIHLHYLRNRAEERLSFDAQIEIAKAMGFKGGARAREGVGAFMQTYFRAAKEVGALTEIMIATIEEEFHGPAQGLRHAWRQRREECEGFYRIAGRLAVSGAQHLAQTPLDFLRFFLVAHEHGIAPAPSTLRLMTQNLRLIDADLKASRRANDLFLKLLTHKKNPTPTLKTMNETGVLAAFLPEWTSIVGLMQFNHYHHYTVDEHTLHAIDQLHQLRAGDLGNETALAHRVFGQIEDPLVLFVAMLYHDIAKSRPGQHEVEGARLAPAICARLGLNRAQTQMVAWLILEHLSLSAAAFQRDMDDPETLRSIAHMSQSVESLRLLYILTVADVRAVGPDTWSAWKGALLHRAYIGAGEILRSGEVGQGAEIAAGVRRREVAQILAGHPPEKIATFLSAAPDAYWLAYEPEDCRRHFDLFQRPPSVHLSILKKQKTVALSICAQDTPGLFARLAGSVALAGWSVDAGKAHTFTNALALDTLFVRPLGKMSINDASGQASLKKTVARALSGALSLQDIARRLPRGRTKRQSALDRPATVHIHSPEVSANPTIIEVTGPDRRALLFDLTAVIMRLGLTLQSIRVATYGARFVNVFYVTDIKGHDLQGEERLNQVRTALLRAAEGQSDL